MPPDEEEEAQREQESIHLAYDLLKLNYRRLEIELKRKDLELQKKDVESLEKEMEAQRLIRELQKRNGELQLEVREFQALGSVASAATLDGSASVAGYFLSELSASPPKVLAPSPSDDQGKEHLIDFRQDCLAPITTHAYNRLFPLSVTESVDTPLSSEGDSFSDFAFSRTTTAPLLGAHPQTSNPTTLSASQPDGTPPIFFTLPFNQLPASQLPSPSPLSQTTSPKRPIPSGSEDKKSRKKLKTESSHPKKELPHNWKVSDSFSWVPKDVNRPSEAGTWNCRQCHFRDEPIDQQWEEPKPKTRPFGKYFCGRRDAPGSILTRAKVHAAKHLNEMEVVFAEVVERPNSSALILEERKEECDKNAGDGDGLVYGAATESTTQLQRMDCASVLLSLKSREETRKVYDLPHIFESASNSEPPSAGEEDLPSATKNPVDIHVVYCCVPNEKAHFGPKAYIPITPSPSTPNHFTSTDSSSQSWVLEGPNIYPEPLLPTSSPTTIYSYHHFPPSTCRLSSVLSNKTTFGSTTWWKLQVCESFHKNGGGWWTAGKDRRPVRCIDHFSGCQSGGAELGKLARAIQKDWNRRRVGGAG